MTTLLGSLTSPLPFLTRASSLLVTTLCRTHSLYFGFFIASMLCHKKCLSRPPLALWLPRLVDRGSSCTQPPPSALFIRSGSSGHSPCSSLDPDLQAMPLRLITPVIPDSTLLKATSNLANHVNALESKATIPAPPRPTCSPSLNGHLTPSAQ